MGRLSKAAAGSAALLLAMVIAACGSAKDTDPATATGPTPISGQWAQSGDEALPTETRTDWVTYGTHVVLAKITAERLLSLETMPASTPNDGDGTRARIATFSIIRTLWKAKGEADLPPTVDQTVFGVKVTGGKSTPSIVRGRPGFLVGETYIVPFTMFQGERSLLSADVGVPVSGMKYAYESRKPAVIELTGKTAAEVAQILAKTPPDPVAAKYPDLTPEQRWGKVSQAQRASSTDSG
ncbi:hypothetical protein [Luteipulveratus mongoliensis]|uniref:Lipoprotein n=1 Tax=Luteipulveratus mongoliensis TaxID=571913 RepID=A0A0K1JF89_9MICO|nr:hypothetical protein [Luteipulveratus mongoliensis]AKU15371.1 hypothetical protein VV02_04980 [Luteipulveratus mongoliensis]